MSRWQRVASADDLWDGEMRRVVVEDTRVLLIRVDGRVHVYLDRCAHLGAPLSKGCLEGTRLTCAAHHWQYDVTTGRGIKPETARLSALPLEIRGDDIFVDVAAADAGAREDRVVGPVLLRSATAQAVAQAIRAANPGARIESRGAYLRVSAPAPCVVTRDQVEEETGAPFELPGDLERVMPSYRGRFAMTEREMRWS